MQSFLNSFMEVYNNTTSGDRITFWWVTAIGCLSLIYAVMQPLIHSWMFGKTEAKIIQLLALKIVRSVPTVSVFIGLGVAGIFWAAYGIFLALEWKAAILGLQVQLLISILMSTVLWIYIALFWPMKRIDDVLEQLEQQKAQEDLDKAHHRWSARA